jgi:hypothetical protein
MHAVPPRAMGKKVSMIRCVVIRGSVGYSRSISRRASIADGIERRTGQRIAMEN